MRKYDPDIEALLGPLPSPRFIIFSSYGNDSIALIQWAHENELEGVVVVYSDTQWAEPWWLDRVEEMEAWVRSLGFRVDRTTSVGFKELARQKKGFPTNQYQWCSYILKIEPGMRWLAENDPDRRAVCLVGVRQEESTDRRGFPPFKAKSASHDGRVLLAPLATLTEAERNEYLQRAGVEPLPHRSLECSPCINAKRDDLRQVSEPRISEIRALEKELGFTRKGKPRVMFRPHLKMGATGIDEVVKWAKADHGKYKPPAGAPTEPAPDNDLPEENLMSCEPDWACGS